MPLRLLPPGSLFMFVLFTAGASAQPAEVPPAPPPAAAPAATPTPQQPGPAPAATPAPQQPGPAGPSPSAQQSAPAATPTAAAPAPAAVAAACVPACRSGFTCVQGQCVSACNPPCAQGETCADGGECVHLPAGPPPPRFYATPEAEIIPGPAHGAEEHDGFMLRLTVGIGGGSAVRHVKHDLLGELGGDGKTTFTGLADSFSVDIGGAIADNLILHGRLSTFDLGQPRIERRGERVPDDDRNVASSALFGPALTYYFMPANLYLTGAIGVGAVVAVIADEDKDAQGVVAVAFNFDVGKEWWVGDQWGLGIAARLYLAGGSRDQDGVDRDYSMAGAAALFSATYQ